MSLVKVSGNASGTGTLTIAAPNTNSDYTLTLPTNTGTLITTASTFAGTGPAFSAYQSSAQAVTNSVTSKVQFQTEEFDTNSNFDSTTNYRFTPTVAGYYQINALVTSSATPNQCYGNCSVYKNGSVFKTGSGAYALTSATVGSNVSTLVYLNGSTDYVEIYNILVGASINLSTGVSNTYFQGVLVRSA